MADIEWDKHKKETLIAKLQAYFSKELDSELGQFDADFLLDFVTKEFGPYFYNQGLKDARAVLEAKLETIDDDLYAIEKEEL